MGKKIILSIMLCLVGLSCFAFSEDYEMLLLERDDYEDEVMELRERNQELEERNQQLENENDELERNLEKTRNYKRLQQIQKVGKPGTYIFYDY